MIMGLSRTVVEYVVYAVGGGRMGLSKTGVESVV